LIVQKSGGTGEVSALVPARTAYAPVPAAAARSLVPAAPYISRREDIFRSVKDIAKGDSLFGPSTGVDMMVEIYGAEFLTDYWSWSGAATVGLLPGGEQRICPLPRVNDLSFDFARSELVVDGNIILMRPAFRSELRAPFDPKRTELRPAVPGVVVPQGELLDFFKDGLIHTAGYRFTWVVWWPVRQLARLRSGQLIGREGLLSAEARELLCEQLVISVAAQIVLLGRGGWLWDFALGGDEVPAARALDRRLVGSGVVASRAVAGRGGHRIAADALV
jgi:hypothetical protein